MNGNVQQSIAPRASLYTNQVHEEITENNIDPILSTERLDNGTHDEESVPNVPPPDVPEVRLTREQTIKALIKQLGFYFSPGNLAGDHYLKSQMDKNQYVPVWTLANFNLVKRITSDLNLVIEALEQCPSAQLNEAKDKVRPCCQRCVVLLREISQDTPQEEVQKLISGNGCPSFVSCEFAGNNSWYVTYSTDDDAQAAYTYFRENIKEFRGKPIHARIKARAIGNIQNNLNTNFVQQQNVEPVYESAAGAAAGAASAPAPPTYTPSQNRFFHTGSSNTQMPPLQQLFYQQPYPTGPYIPIVQSWPNNYVEFSGVFSMNGLTPQQPHKVPYKNNAKSKKKVAGQPEQQVASPAGLNAARSPHAHVAATHRGNTNIRGPSIMSDMTEPPMQVSVPYIATLPMIDMSMGYGYVPQQMVMTKESMPPRHKKKRREDENIAGPSQPPQPEVEQRTFDLGHSAFPPLKNHRHTNNTSEENQEETNAEPPTTWSSKDIIDILKRSTTSKNSSRSTSSKGSLCANDNESPRPGSPRINDCKEATDDIEGAFSSALNLSPPASPGKNQDAKCTMTDKSTKTDDVLMNGESEASPLTANAATMTTAGESSTANRTEAPKPATSSNAPPRMSYAQVAQHAKEIGTHKEKKDSSAEGEVAQTAAVHNGDKKGKDFQAKEKPERNRQDASTRSSGAVNGPARRQKKSKKNSS